MVYISTNGAKRQTRTRIARPGYAVNVRRAGATLWQTKRFTGRGALDAALKYQRTRPFGSEIRLVPITPAAGSGQ